MNPVALVDTSILCNLLEIPRRCQHRDEVAAELERRIIEGTLLLLPIATVIETGNHVLQIADGGLRRIVAEKFSALLKETADGRMPWTPNEITWNSSFIKLLHEGASSGSTLVELISHQIAGGGDVSILAKRDDYRRRTRIQNVSIWTMDTKLGAFNN